MANTIQTQARDVSRDQLREQIRQTVRDAQVAAEQAAKDAQQAQGSRAGPVVVWVPPVPPLPGIPSTSVSIQRSNDIPPQVATISIAFFVTIAAIIIGLPIMRAIARRIERGTPVAPPMPREVSEQLQQISHSVEAIAIEVERISEGQRFTSKLLSEQTRAQST
ncbi:MAG: hypothetical protein ABIS03_11660 [Gemmatimonadaceae bacterium]